MKIFYGVDYFRRSFESLHPATSRADTMPTSDGVKAYIIRSITLKVMTFHDVQFQKQAHGIVERGPAYGKIIVSFQFLSQFIQCEMTFDITDSVKYGKPFRSFPLSICFKILSQKLLNRFSYAFFHFANYISLERYKSTQFI